MVWHYFIAQSWTTSVSRACALLCLTFWFSPLAHNTTWKIPIRHFVLYRRWLARGSTLFSSEANWGYVQSSDGRHFETVGCCWSEIDYLRKRKVSVGTLAGCAEEVHRAHTTSYSDPRVLAYSTVTLGSLVQTLLYFARSFAISASFAEFPPKLPI